jgi:hypothetical protein
MYHEPDKDPVQRYSDDLDSMDSSVWNGEMLWCNINEFEWYVKRWQKAIDEHRKLCDDVDEQDSNE